MIAYKKVFEKTFKISSLSSVNINLKLPKPMNS